MIASFILGAITGGTIVWFYRRDIRRYVDDKTGAIGARAADTLQSAAEGLEAAKDKIETGLRGKRRTG